MSDIIQVLLLFWFIGSVMWIVMNRCTKSYPIFRTAIIGYISNYGAKDGVRLVSAIDDLGNNVELVMKTADAARHSVGDKITVTVPQ